MRLTGINLTYNLVDPRLVITRNGNEPKPRVYHALPSLVPDTMFGIYNNSVDVAAVAITERLLNLKVGGELTTPISPMRGIFDTTEMRRFSKGIAYYVKQRAHVYSHREVVEMYSGHKLKVYTNAYQKFMEEGCAAKSANLNVFIKYEKVNVTKAPRIISPRQPVYNLCLARFLKKMEKQIYKAIHKQFKSVSRHTVYKGMNVLQTASDMRVKWENFSIPCAIAGDITKLDMHIRTDALNFEHSVYNMAINNRTLKRLLKLQHTPLKVSYFPDGKININDVPGKPVVASRASGDVNTSMGNVIIVCAMIWTFSQTYQVPVELVNNGDDFVIITDSKYAIVYTTLLPTWFKFHGFVLAMETPVYEFESIQFCQTQPVLVDSTWIMCRDPSTILKKDVICTIPINGSTVLQKWLDAVGTCGLSLTAGVPILQAFYMMYVRNGIVCGEKFKQHIFRNTGVMERTSGMTWKYTRVKESTRWSFYLAFGVLPDLQRALEEYLDTVVIDETIEHALPEQLIRDSSLIHNYITYEISR